MKYQKYLLYYQCVRKKSHISNREPFHIIITGFCVARTPSPSIPTFWGLLSAINWLWTLHVHSHYLRQYSSAALFTAPIFFLWCKNWIWGSIFNLLSYWVSTKCVISAYLQQSNITIWYLCTLYIHVNQNMTTLCIICAMKHNIAFVYRWYDIWWLVLVGGCDQNSIN